MKITSENFEPSLKEKVDNIESPVSFYLDCDTLDEVKNRGLVTFYTDKNDPYYIRSGSASYEFALQNISTADKKFGIASYDFSLSSYSLVIPKQTSGRIDFSDEFSVSVWIKVNAVTSVTIFEDVNECIKCGIDGSGKAYVTLKEQNTTTHTVTSTTSVNDNTWRNIIVKGKVNSSGSDLLYLYIDGTSEGTPVTGATIDIVGGDTGSIVLGAGKTRVGDTIYTGVALPASSTPSWTKVPSGSPAESVSNGIFTMDTTVDSTSTVTYAITGGANWTVSNAAGSWIECKLKCEFDTEADSRFRINISDGTRSEWLYIKKDRVEFYADALYTTALNDGTKWHTYRMCLIGSTAYLYIDGIKKLQVTPYASGVYDRVEFGDEGSTADRNVKAYIDYIQYYQSDAEETTLYGNELDGYLDSFTVFNKLVTDEDIANLQTKTGSEISTLIDGAQITNIGRSHVAVQELIDQREYEENLTSRASGYQSSGTDIDIPIQFTTKKRVIPTIIFTDSSTTNLSNKHALYPTLNGFTLRITASSSGTVSWYGAWQAQSASYTKFKNIGSSNFTLVKGVPLFDEDGDLTGYSTEEVSVNLADVALVTGDNNLYTFSNGTQSVFIPKCNEEQIVDLIYGIDSDHLAANACKLVRQKMGDTDYNTLQTSLRSKAIYKQQLVGEYQKKLKGFNTKVIELSPKDNFLKNNKNTVMGRINNGDKIVQQGDY